MNSKKMKSFRLSELARDHIEAKEDQTKYIEALILKDKASEREKFLINLQPFNNESRETIKKYLLDNGVHLKKVT